MRVNKFIANATGMSRRAADQAIEQGRVSVGGQPAIKGQEVAIGATVTLDGDQLRLPSHMTTIILNKPTGYVVSREGQGSKTVYDLLPPELHNLKPVGRLDKDSSGLLLMTADGVLAQKLTHPKHQKEKVYEVDLDKPLESADKTKIEQGVVLDDGISSLKLESIDTGRRSWKITMHEGRNRQIRRTFKALGYRVVRLHRVQFGQYFIGELSSGRWNSVDHVSVT